MKNTKGLFRNFLLVCCFLSSSLAFGREILVVTGSSTPVSEISAEQVQSAFLGKPVESGEQALVAIDRQNAPEGVREKFYEKVVARSMTRMKAHWSQLIFTGRGSPPKMADDLADLKKILTSRKAAIGFLDSSEDAAGLKILLRVNGD